MDIAAADDESQNGGGKTNGDGPADGGPAAYYKYRPAGYAFDANGRPPRRNPPRRPYPEGGPSDSEFSDSESGEDETTDPNQTPNRHSEDESLYMTPQTHPPCRRPEVAELAHEPSKGKLVIYTSHIMTNQLR